MRYKTVFIDWNGTLSDSKFWGHLEDKTHPKHHIFEKIEDSLFGSLKHLIKPWMRGEQTSEQIVHQIAKVADLNKEELISEFIESCKSMKLVSDRIFEITKQLQSQGVKVVVATDNMDSFTRWTIPALKLETMFDNILNSYDLGVLKGDFDDKGESLFFNWYLADHELSPTECVLIDDSEDKDGKIQGYGINYRKIKDSSELESVLGDLAQLES